MSEEVVRQLTDQRDFLLANTWVKWAPRAEGEGCLVGRMETPGIIDADWLGSAATFMVLRALELPRGDEPLIVAGNWNDEYCQSAGEAIAVLDEAIRLAKEDGETG